MSCIFASFVIVMGCVISLKPVVALQASSNSTLTHVTGRSRQSKARWSDDQADGSIMHSQRQKVNV